ncbi:hypothetical protein N7492_006904 [Penicillium capsulatum]|uniref:Uncharacterized protein n=1 Tax=Penicillium capsulatum TaxID=69766 RepID=A0A9W9HYU1_9EURO|nr:hypothetical protein N7492_006904 [Penicillium capsulatum]KAJ6116737.1 hypothetical protein N7512_006462 [Penicillium capsulatum]
MIGSSGARCRVHHLARRHPVWPKGGSDLISDVVGTGDIGFMVNPRSRSRGNRHRKASSTMTQNPGEQSDASRQPQKWIFGNRCACVRWCSGGGLKDSPGDTQEIPPNIALPPAESGTGSPVPHQFRQEQTGACASAGPIGFGRNDHIPPGRWGREMVPEGDGEDGNTDPVENEVRAQTKLQLDALTDSTAWQRY